MTNVLCFLNHACFKIHSEYKTDQWILMQWMKSSLIMFSDSLLQLTFTKPPFINFLCTIILSDKAIKYSFLSKIHICVRLDCLHTLQPHPTHRNRLNEGKGMKEGSCLFSKTYNSTILLFCFGQYSYLL